MPSADFCMTNTICCQIACSLAIIQISRGKTRFLPLVLPDLPWHLPNSYWASLSNARLPRCSGLLSGFCSSDPEFRLTLPSDSASRRTPLLRRTVPTVTARSGLSPYGIAPCPAPIYHQFCGANSAYLRRKIDNLF